MLMHNVARGLLQTGLYKCGEDANTDDAIAVIEEMADVKIGN